ncbi:MAG: McrB family protein [bacterium]
MSEFFRQKMLKTNTMESRTGMVLENCYMLGILAEDEPRYPLGLEDKPITIVSSNNTEVVFYIREISTNPQIIDDDNYLTYCPFIGFAGSSFKGVNLNPNYRYYTGMFDRVEMVEEKLKDKLILFQPRLKKDKGKDTIYKNLDIIAVEDIGRKKIKQIKDNKYVPIPGVDMSTAELEEKILNREDVDFPRYNVADMPIPQIIYCNQKLYLISKEQPQWISVPETFNENIIYKLDDNLMFIEKKYYDSLLQKDGERVQGISSYILNASENNIVDFQENNELNFLENLYQESINKRLYYKREDLYTFHTSIKAGRLTILSGMAGTGKTKLAQTYAEVLGLEYNKEYIIIPVNPSYTEPSDLLGYYNVMNESYNPAESGLIDFLIRAEKNKDKVHMVIFDEMNLSQIEYWFAPFLSLLELNEENRLLKLYNDNNNISSGKKYPASISIGDNIIILGTANIDQTTKSFSDRLLDRADVIILNKVKFQDIKNQLENKQIKLKESCQFKHNYSTEFLQWYKNSIDPIEILSHDELALLDRVHVLLQDIDSQKGISFRTINNIARFLINIPFKKGSPIINRKDAFDIQFKQKVLTKIKGHQEQYGQLVGVLDSTTDSQISEGLLLSLLKTDSAQKISHFNISIKELEKKSKEMYFNGYAN